ncbi:MAG: NUDIX hydrolase [Bacteroidota bacterium]
MSKQKTTIVVRLILESENKILFLKKTLQNGGGYSLVGGKVEQRESPEYAIIRESLEEANIHIKPKHLRLRHIYKRDLNQELILLYRAKKWKGNIETKEPDKFKKTVWLDKSDLPRNISNVTRQLLRAYFEERFFEEEELM